MQGIIIIGAGEAGARTALALRRAGHDGSLTLIGAEASLPYDRPPLSKAVLLGKTPTAPPILPEGLYAERRIDLRRGTTVKAIDRVHQVVRLGEGGEVGYDRLVLATGANARPLAVPGGEAALLLRTDLDAAALRERLVPGAKVGVIGGGFIGLEVAASAVAHGCLVTVVELAPRILARAVPPRIAAVMAERHRAAGIRLLTGVAVERLESGAIVLKDGLRIEADTIVAGVGAYPETSLAAAAGLVIDNGIAVDGCLETSDPKILALGDCCSFPHPLFDQRRIRLEAWRNAQDQAAIVAANIMGANEVYRAVPWFWSDQHDLGLQIAGMPDLAAVTVTRDLGAKGLIEAGLAADGRIVAASGVGPGRGVARDIRAMELLIGKRARPAPASLADAALDLRSLLREGETAG